MSVLQEELMQTTNELSEDGLKAVLEYVRRFIIPYDNRMRETASTSRIGSRKGVKFLAEGHDVDDYNDEIEEMFGVTE